MLASWKPARHPRPVLRTCTPAAVRPIWRSLLPAKCRIWPSEAATRTESVGEHSPTNCSASPSCGG